MNSTEIYQDIKSHLSTMSCTDAFKIGLVSNIMWLPIKVSKMNVWYMSSGNDAYAVFKQLHEDYGLEFKDSAGQYIYAYNIEDQQY